MTALFASEYECIRSSSSVLELFLCLRQRAFVFGIFFGLAHGWFTGVAPSASQGDRFIARLRLRPPEKRDVRRENVLRILYS